MKKLYLFLVSALLALSLPGLVLGAATQLPFDKVTVGKNTTSTKEMRFNKNAGTGNPGFRYNSATGKMESSNDGTTWKAVGSGSGGGGGGGVVLNSNYGFEEDLEGWAETGGGTLTLVSTAANVGFGEKSASFDASASSDYLQGQTAVIPSGLYGKVCTLSWYYKGGDANLKAQVYDGANVIAESSAFTAQTNYSAKQVIYFTCPSSGTLQARFIASADAALVYIDDVKLGQETGIGGGGSGLVASGYITGSGCGASKSGATLQSFATAAGCAGPVVENNPGPGVLLSTDYDLPKFTIQALPPGTYRVTFYGSFGTATASNKSIAITDGTTTAGRGSMYLATSFNDAVPVTAYFTYSSQADRTFEMVAASVSGIINYDADDSNNQRVWFSVDRMQGSGPADQIVSIDQAGWSIDGNISGGDAAIGLSTQLTYAELSNPSLAMSLSAGSAPAKITCDTTNPATGLTCAAGNETIGLQFNPPSAGKYDICMSVTHEMQNSTGGAMETWLKLVETPGAAQTILQEGGERLGSGGIVSGSFNHYHPRRVCGSFTFSDTSIRTIRMFRTTSISGTATVNHLMMNGSSGTGDQVLTFSVRRKVEFADAVKFTNMVTAPQVAAGLKVAYARFSDVCVISEQDGSFSSPVNNSTGRCTFAMSGFSVTPMCVCNTTGNSGGFCSPSLNSASSVQTNMIGHAGSNTAYDGHMICIGK